MRAQIDNTATATQKGAPLNQSRFERANQSRFERANQSSHAPGKISRNSRRFSHIPKINRHKIPYSVTSEPLWQSITLTALGGSACLPSACRGTDRQASSALTDGHVTADNSRPTSSLDTLAFLLDTPVEIKIDSTLVESMRSPKTSRYTFDMF
jgi:hypothetical protein